MNELEEDLKNSEAGSTRSVLRRLKHATSGLVRAPARLLRLAEAGDKLADQITNADGKLNHIFERLENISSQLADNQSENNKRNQSVVDALLSAGLCARRLRDYQKNQSWNSEYAAAEQRGIDAAFAEMQAIDPVAYPVWRTLFENGKRSYYEQREASCSHRDHWHAKLFGAYVDIYSYGRLLDIGCGPHGVPSYLSAYDPSLISGLEPLPATTTPNFEFVRGFNEHLPWPDQSFHTVVSGTSLDHVLSIEQSLAEVSRVLVDGGRYLVWLASIPGSPPYVPASSPPIPVDDFHLFHFDRAWIEPIFERSFRIIDVTVVKQVGFDHIFYCMVPLK
ncbi:MAG: class I SAM-dependent methyltransferase [Hyphomicrobiaceae bacterium]